MHTAQAACLIMLLEKYTFKYSLEHVFKLDSSRLLVQDYGLGPYVEMSKSL